MPCLVLHASYKILPGISAFGDLFEIYTFLDSGCLLRRGQVCLSRDPSSVPVSIDVTVTPFTTSVHLLTTFNNKTNKRKWFNLFWLVPSTAGLAKELWSDEDHAPELSNLNKKAIPNPGFFQLTVLVLPRWHGDVNYLCLICSDNVRDIMSWELFSLISEKSVFTSALFREYAFNTTQKLETHNILQ